MRVCLPVQGTRVETGTFPFWVPRGRSYSVTCAWRPLGSEQVCKEPAGFPDMLLLRVSRVRMAAVTVHSQLRKLPLGDQHFNYPLSLQKNKKKDTSIYPSDWFDSCHSDNLSLAERDLVLVLRLALCASYGRLALRNGNMEAAAWYPDRRSPPAPASPPAGHGLISRLKLGTMTSPSPNPGCTQWTFQATDGPICKWHAWQGCHSTVCLRKGHR